MAPNKDFLLILKSHMLGEGEPDLGEKLIKSFLEQLNESGNLPARIICVNSGIFLSTEGSAVIDILRKFETDGSEVISCGTCLDYYKRRDKLIIGQPTNMKVMVGSMLSYKKILAP